MGRWKDTFQTIFGRRDYQIAAAAQMARIEAQWCAICQEIANTLEQLNRLDARLNKREQRARKPKPPEPVAEAIATPQAGDRKALARARFSERGLVPSAASRLPQLATPEDGNEPSE